MTEPVPPPFIPGPTPEPPVYDGPIPLIPPAQILSALRTPGQQPLCYERNPDIGRTCNLSIYHPGAHRCHSGDGTYYVYWESSIPPGPIPDPDPQPPIDPEPVPPLPEPIPETAQLQPDPPSTMPTSADELTPLPAIPELLPEPAYA